MSQRVMGRRVAGLYGGVLLAVAVVVATVLPAAAAEVVAGQVAPRRLPEMMPGDRVLLVEGEAGATEIWSAELDGSDRRRLTSGEAGGPRWSPDGARVAFTRVNPVLQPWVMHADGQNARPIAERGYAPAWSPDARRVVFATDFEDPDATDGPLRVADLATGAVIDVPGTERGDDPVWSPDGGRIAFTRLDQQGTAVFTIRPDGQDMRRVALLSGDAAQPSWSPDGAQLAVWGSADGTAQALYAVDRRGGERRVLASGFGEEHVVVPPAVWSPDGDVIAFSARRADGASLDVWVVGADGSGRRRLTTAAQDDYPVIGWTADARAVVFNRAETGGDPSSDRDAWLVRLTEAPTARRITDTGDSTAADVGPGVALRVAGRDRIATAVELAQTREHAPAVVIARADTYPDALAGAPLAAAVDAPVLLTGRERLDARVRAEIRRLGAATAYLLGGQGALSDEVAQDLRAAGVNSVQRFAGRDRFDTARLIAEAVTEMTGAQAAYVVEGSHPDPRRGWPDAVAVSGLAAAQRRPILLVTRDSLPQPTRAALHAGITQVTIVGGEGAVSPQVADALSQAGTTVDRIAGFNRYHTSVAVAERAIATGADGAQPWLATGRNWPDALAAGPAVAADGGVLLLVDGHDLAGSWSSRYWLEQAAAERVVLVGGPGAIRPAVAAQVEYLAPSALPPITFTSHQSGDAVEVGEITVTGEACTYEAYVDFTLVAPDGSRQQSFTQATHMCRGEWAHTFALTQPGTWEIIATALDPAGDESPPPFQTSIQLEAS